ncbi:MAG: hypothetical protein JXQ75_11620 [Phycisphaerae bacterium]|nr:hypothetical protein [Phycisphaerae bacterium]
MFESLNNVDWSLLHQQKLTLLEMLSRRRDGSAEAEALAGVINLLDALQDDAAAHGRWTFPGEADNASGAEQPVSKRYYVEDEDGHHHGPLDEYEEAVGVADAIHGRIIVQETEQLPAPFMDEDPDGGA